MTTEPKTEKTICVHCRWHRILTGVNGGHYCASPRLGEQPVNYVTGEMLPSGVRRCDRLNRSGECPYYHEEEKDDN